MSANQKKNILVILGPTAVGKTAVSIDIAKNINAEIISADSMLVYQDMDIATAKPTKDELACVKHHLIDIVEPDCLYNVSDFVTDARKAINEIVSSDKKIVICGGTNYYVSALLDGMYEGPEANAEIRDKLYSILEEEGIDYLYNMLETKDPLSAKSIHKNNIKRVIRALEVLEITGKPHSAMSKTPGIKDEYNIIKIGLSRSKEELYKRIEKRVELMFEAGLIDEVKKLIKRGIKNSTTACVSIGYKETIDFLEKNKYNNTLDLKQDVVKNTKKLVKKQLTWLKRDNEIIWYNLSSDFDVLNKIINDIKKN